MHQAQIKPPTAGKIPNFNQQSLTTQTPGAARSLLTDEQILKARGEVEPKPNAKDICSLGSLRERTPQFVKFTSDGGATWRYAVINDYFYKTCVSNPGYTTRPYTCKLTLDYSVDMYLEVMPNGREKLMINLHDEVFSKYKIFIRPATQVEVEGIEFSHRPSREFRRSGRGLLTAIVTRKLENAS